MGGYWQIDRWFSDICPRQIGKILENGWMDGWIHDVCHRHRMRRYWQMDRLMMFTTDRMERYWQMDGWISDACHRHRMGEYWQMDSFYCSYLLAEEVIP